MSTVTITEDNTTHKRQIEIENAPDMYTKCGRGGCWFSPSFMTVRWKNREPRKVWIGGMKRNKNGDLGKQDTGEWFTVEGQESYFPEAPAWALELIGRVLR